MESSELNWIPNANVVALFQSRSDACTDLEESWLYGFVYLWGSVYGGFWTSSDIFRGHLAAVHLGILVPLVPLCPQSKKLFKDEFCWMKNACMAGEGDMLEQMNGFNLFLFI